MVLSDFHNGYTSVSLYSQYSLTSHSVRVAEKKCVGQKTMLRKQKYIAQQNYVSHKKYVVATKKIMWNQKRDSYWLYMFSVAQKRNTCWQKKFMLYINICCID